METLASLESAEKITGQKMPNPEVYHSVAQIRAKGSLVENLIQNNGRITGDMIDVAATSKEEEKPKQLPQVVKQVEIKKEEVKT